MPIIKLNHIELYYEQHGHGDDLILIGGLSSDHHVWKSTIRLFSSHFRVTIFDNRGSGKSSTPDFTYTTELMAQDVLALMDAISIDRAHVVGHSMGGCIAQQLCVLAPYRIKKCITVCTRANSSPVANMIFTMREKLQAANIPVQLLAEYVMPFLFSNRFLSVSAQVKGFIQWSLQNTHPQSAIGFKQQLHAVQTHDIFERLSTINTPTLVIAGAEDLLVPRSTSEAIAQQLAHGQLKIMDDCAHMPHVEQSKAFAQVVLGFL